MAGRALFSLTSLILVAGGLLLMLFIALAGAVNKGPMNKWYFLEVDTSNIPNAPDLSRWTYWNTCGVSSGVTVCGTQQYSRVHPAYPLDPPSGRNFATTVNIPAGFIGTNFYFYMTRFMFAFMLIALFFATCAFFTGILALCTRLGSYLSSVLTMIAFFFQALNASLMTAAYVKGRDNFRRNGQSASIGQYAFGFEWAALFCLFVASILFCVGGSSRRSEGVSHSSSRRGFFGGKRSKSTRSRGSFIDSNKEYA